MTTELDTLGAAVRHHPVVTVTGGSNKRVSPAVLMCRPGILATGLAATIRR